jgi:hypothetical protein
MRGGRKRREVRAGIRSGYFCRILSASAFRFSWNANLLDKKLKLVEKLEWYLPKGCSSLNLERVIVGRISLCNGAVQIAQQCTAVKVVI